MSADHNELLDLRALGPAAQETEGQERTVMLHVNTSKDKSIYSQRGVGHIRERENKQQVGENQLVIHALLLHDQH